MRQLDILKASFGSLWIPKASFGLPHPKEDRSKYGFALKAPSQYTREQIIQALLHCVDLTQGPRLSRLRLLLGSVFREKHGNGSLHDHVPAQGCRSFRFNPIKQALLREYGLATHWSCTHEYYASCVAYCYLHEMGDCKGRVPRSSIISFAYPNPCRWPWLSLQRRAMQWT
jgi:hypothetical protein